MKPKQINRIENPTKEMKEYALKEMINLIGNMRVRPVDIYSQKTKENGKQFFLGRTFCENLIEALKNQYSS